MYLLRPNMCMNFSNVLKHRNFGIGIWFSVVGATP